MSSRGILSLISFQGSCPNSLAKAMYSMKKHRGRQAMRNIQSIELFSDISMNPQTDEENEGGIAVEINLKEREPKSAEASIQPGGTVTFQHRNIEGLNTSIIGSMTSSNFLNPQILHLKLTKFIPLKKVEEGDGKPPPPVLILNGHYGGCVGYLPSYDAFPLGGPYSVRGYSMGELGSCRNNLEVGAELRIPVKNTRVYAFVEHGNDLGSSKDVKGNPTQFLWRQGHSPTQFLWRQGHSSSYGVGVKLRSMRVEHAVDHNVGEGAVFFGFGERF